MQNFWWLIHILGISLWLGVTAGVLIVWPSRKALTAPSSTPLNVRTLVALMTSVGHIGAGLTALAGVVLSFMEQPKSELSTVWLETMQGLGAIAFILSVIVLTRVGKRLIRSEASSVAATAGRYRLWLSIVVVLLLICLIMAAFKPSAHVL